MSIFPLTDAADPDQEQIVIIQRSGSVVNERVSARYDHARKDWILMLPEGPVPARSFIGFARFEHRP